MVHPELLPYPIDMFPLLKRQSTHVDEPTYFAQNALAHWNAYLIHGDEKHKDAFMIQAHWLLAHSLPLWNGASGWPIPFAFHNYYASRPCLSALTQGNAISVLVRAYQLTHEDAFLYVARRAVRTFELDILDGGVNAPLGDTGIFFEEIAVYPVAHVLKGHILALFGLYDYVTIISDNEIEVLIQRGLMALHALLDVFDMGYWTRYDLLHKRLASWTEHALHVRLLEAIAGCAGCNHCATLAVRWRTYQRLLKPCLHYLIASRLDAYWNDTLKSTLRHLAFRTTSINNYTRDTHVCVPTTAFPVPGGMRGVLNGVAQVMGTQWQTIYLTHHKGQDAEGLLIEVFGRRIASPWQFPGVWLYSVSGWIKLFKMLWRSSGYGLILPQDGVFTAAFAALAGKMTGIRVVCMDHGNVTWLNNPAFRAECIASLQTYAWYRRIFLSFLFRFYVPSLRLLARIATQNIDQFLVAGDEVEEVYRKTLGVHPSRIIRYAYMVDSVRFTPPNNESRIRMRLAQGLAEEAIVITLINRLAPEKGLHFALEGIALALSALQPDVQTRVKVLLVGSGPLRSQVEADIQRLELSTVCVLWGEANLSDVVTLLGISDIFLYSGTRGTNYSMAVLEAMAAGCAVVASVVPQSNARLLAEGRGIAIPPASATEISVALIRLCNNPALCHHMGQIAREYVMAYHNALMLKRSLLRASFFAPSLEEVASDGLPSMEIISNNLV